MVRASDDHGFRPNATAPADGVPYTHNVVLARTVRFCVNDALADESSTPIPEKDGFHNTYAAAPSMIGLGRYYELVIRSRGEIDPRTGYFMDIKRIDDAARRTCIPAITEACRRTPSLRPSDLLAAAMPALDNALAGSLASVRWRLTPHYSIEVQMTTDPTGRRLPEGHYLLRQRFDFAASHRLHCPQLSDDENRALFGKCNNLRGHGHNYQVEPCVRVLSTGGAPRSRFDLRTLERITDRVIIERFDHKHLNEDVDDFRAPVNPSVENIARVCFELLAPEVRAASEDATLALVTVWETEKTCATYPG